MAAERLQKILAHAGVASRRAAEELIRAGRVAVDGVVVTELGSKADLASQRVTVDGQPLGGPQNADYWMVHKPPGVVSTAADPQGRTRVTELLPPEVAGRLYPVGRLDLDSEGLVLLTNDGELAYRLMHPRFAVPKHYRVWVAGRPNLEALQRLRTGVLLEGRLTAPARVSLSGGGPLRSKMTFILHEGRKREIRLMCAAVGHPVQRLVRLGLGPLKLGDLPIGAARRLTPSEVAALKGACRAGQGVSRAASPERASQAPGERLSGDRKPCRWRADAPDACRGASPAGRCAPGACRAGRSGSTATSPERVLRAPGESSSENKRPGRGASPRDAPTPDARQGAGRASQGVSRATPSGRSSQAPAQRPPEKAKPGGGARRASQGGSGARPTGQGGPGGASPERASQAPRERPVEDKKPGGGGRRRGQSGSGAAPHERTSQTPGQRPAEDRKPGRGARRRGQSGPGGDKSRPGRSRSR
jgi:23S rRNA pseudouridine2605 synthase